MSHVLGIENESNRTRARKSRLDSIFDRPLGLHDTYSLESKSIDQSYAFPYEKNDKFS